jgi:hypothetical protein
VQGARVLALTIGLGNRGEQLACEPAPLPVTVTNEVFRLSKPLAGNPEGFPPISAADFGEKIDCARTAPSSRVRLKL